MRSTHIAEEPLFSMFPSTLTFDFDLIYRLFFLAFGAQMGNFWGWNFVKKCFVVYSYSTTTFVFLLS